MRFKWIKKKTNKQRIYKMINNILIINLFIQFYRMDLQVYLMIVVIFFGSLAFLLFINRHIQSGKTFEEALAEKRRLTEKLYGTNKKKKNASNKSNKKVKTFIFIKTSFNKIIFIMFILESCRQELS